MASFELYDSRTVKLEEGTDEKGNYIKYKCIYEVPCGCHPETCCHFDEKKTRIEIYKQYKDGSKVCLNK